jgi:hypothetical protein
VIIMKDAEEDSKKSQKQVISEREIKEPKVMTFAESTFKKARDLENKEK